MSVNPKVSIIIVYYDHPKLLLECLRSIYKNNSKTRFEVIVVNNSLQNIKKLLDKFKLTKLINSKTNLGFGGGNNLGSIHAKGEYLLFLNPDTKIIDDPISTLSGFLDNNKNVAIVAPNLVDNNGEIYPQLGANKLTPISGIVYHSFINKLFPNNHISRIYSLANIPNTKLREVQAVPGSAFMIRTSDFKKAGKFDENIFLYFEESDLGLRIGKLNKKIYINPKARVMHHWGKNRGDSHLKKYFEKSRFYYFRKHYGLFWALIVESFAKFSANTALIILLIALGAFLRFYRLPSNLVFHGELGHNYLAIYQAWQEKKIPLLGPPTSHPWLYFGPLFYWLLGPFLVLSKFNPVTGAYFMAFMGTLIIPVNYLFVSKLFNKKLAFISSFLLTFSIMFINLTREARFFSLVVIFFYPFLYFLSKIKNSPRLNYPFLLGLFWGIALNFHLSVVIYLPVILIIFASHLKYKQFAFFGLGLLIPNLPFLIFDLFHGLKMTQNLAMWFPYRIAGFFGLVPKNTVSAEVLEGNATSLLNFLSNWIYQNNFIGLMTFFIITALIWRIFRDRSQLSNLKILAIIFIVGILAIFIHGNPPIHYYLPLYIPFILLLSTAFSSLGKRYLLFTLAIFALISLANLTISRWYFHDEAEILSDLVPYNLQVHVVDSIVAQYQDTICLGRRGPGDQFEGDYAQNYQYLLQIRGIKARKCSSDEIVICERAQCSGTKIFSNGGLEAYKINNDPK